ncbi:MAG: hypothetical protein QW057_00880 [Candidatus Bathyarchaeia archaeon]
MPATRKRFQATELVSLDEHGCVKLSEDVLQALDIEPRTTFLAVGELTPRRIILYPVAMGGRRLVEVLATIKDRPGSLGEIATALGEVGVNIETSILPPGSGGLCEWIAVIDVTESKLELEELKTKLGELSSVESVEVVEVS